MQAPAGTWASSLPCKTTNTENLDVSWAQAAGVANGGFVWRAGTPPGNDPVLDRQLIILTPMTLCVTAGQGGNAATSRDSVMAPNPILERLADDPRSGFEPDGTDLD